MLQSSPTPNTWIQDGGAVFAEPVLRLTAQLPLQLCTHHAPPSPVPLQPTWIQDGGCVCRTGSLSSCPAPAPTLHPSCPSQSSPYPTTWDPRWRRCMCGTGSLSSCPAPAPTLLPSCSSPLPVRHHRSDSQPEMEKKNNFLY
jgi:hypothetical protein